METGVQGWFCGQFCILWLLSSLPLCPSLPPPPFLSLLPPFLLLPLPSLLSLSPPPPPSPPSPLTLPPFLSPSSSHSLFVVFPARAPTNITQLTPEQVQMGVVTGEGRNARTQAGYQLALLGVTLFVSIIGGLLTGT